MKKELPKIKKSLKTFILEEDAKVIDKTASKIAIFTTFLSINFLTSVDDVNAKGHGSHANHANALMSSEGYLESEDGEPFANAVHGNHFNHNNGSGNC